MLWCYWCDILCVLDVGGDGCVKFGENGIVCCIYDFFVDGVIVLIVLDQVVFVIMLYYGCMCCGDCVEFGFGDVFVGEFVGEGFEILVDFEQVVYVFVGQFCCV